MLNLYCGSMFLFFFCSELLSVYLIGNFECFAALSVQCSLVVICWERAKLLAHLYVMYFNFVYLSLSHVMAWVMGGT